MDSCSSHSIESRVGWGWLGSGDTDGETCRSAASTNFRVCVRSRRCHEELARSELPRSAGGWYISRLRIPLEEYHGSSFPLFLFLRSLNQFPSRDNAKRGGKRWRGPWIQYVADLSNTLCPYRDHPGQLWSSFWPVALQFFSRKDKETEDGL